MTLDHKLKTGFRALYPEYAKQLEAAKSQEELTALHAGFILAARKNLADALGKDVSQLTDADTNAPIPLSQDQYDALVSASGDGIKQQLQSLVNGLQNLNGMKQDDPGLVSAQLYLAGALGMGEASSTEVGTQLEAGADEISATYQGVIIASVMVICAMSGLVIVSILIPIIYFMLKPANCIVLLINELDAPITFLEEYNVHGKPSLKTLSLKAKVYVPPVKKSYYVAGFFATEKRDGASYGTQYGFVMKYKDTKLAFGVESPLTSMYVDNNCYCAIGEDAGSAANNTDDHNNQSYTAYKDGINLSIKANSGSGSIAYYVARAYKS